MPDSRPRLTLSLMLALTLSLAAACGSSGPSKPSSGTTGSASSISVDDSARALLPDDVRTSGKLVVATDASYPPMEYLDSDNKTIIGLDVDLGHAIARKLGVTFTFTNVTFDGIIAGLTSGRFDIAMSDMVDKREREKAVDFVTYLSASAGLLVRADNPDKITDLASLCGKTIALQTGTNAVDVVAPQVTKCKSSADGPLTVKQFPDAASAKQALTAGRAVAYMDDAVSMAYAAQKAPKTFMALPGAYAPAPLGIAVPKTDPDLRDAILAALTSLMDDGTYATILKKWDSQNVAIQTAGVNQATY